MSRMPGTSCLSSMAMSFNSPPSHSILLTMKTSSGEMVARKASRATAEVIGGRRDKKTTANKWMEEKGYEPHFAVAHRVLQNSKPFSSI